MQFMLFMHRESQIRASRYYF